MTTPPITAVSAVLLVDQRIQDYETIVSAVKDDVRYIVFDVEDKSYPSMIEYIKAKIIELNVASFDTIGLAQYNEHQTSYQMFGPSSPIATIDNIITSDPTLQTWSYITDLFIWLKTTYAIKHFDMLACALYIDINWKYIIDNLSTISGLEVRASSNRTGSNILGGDWILESAGVNLKNVYFNETIDNFEGVLDIAGTVVNTVPAPTAPLYGSNNSEFTGPTLIKFYNDKLYVCDSANHRIQIFDTSLNFISKFGSEGTGNGKFIAPYDLAINPSNGRIHVVSYSSHDVNVFDSSYNYLFRITGFSYPRAIALDSAGNIYTSEGYVIKKFSSSGTYIGMILAGYGSADGQLLNATTLVFDASDNLWICDSGTGTNRVQKFSSSGTYISKFGTNGTGNGQFQSPYGLVFDSSGNIFVGDHLNHRIQKFDSNGTYISQFGSNGTGNGQFDRPNGIALDSTGNIFVVENYNHRVQKFNSSGVYQSKIGALITSSSSANGSFNTPSDVAMFPSNGNVYVVDTGNNRIQKFNSSLTWVWSVGSTGSGNSQFNTPRRLAIDASENIYVTDAVNHCVKKFDSSGSFLLKFGTNGTGTGQFTTPYGIAVDSAFNVFVTDNNSRVQKFGSDGTYITSYSIFNSRAISLDSTGNMYITSTNQSIYKYSSSGTLLLTLASQGNIPTGISVDPVSSNFAVIFESSQYCRIYNSSGTLQVSTSFNSTMNTPYGVYYNDTTLFYTDRGYHGIKKVTLTGITVAPTYTFTTPKPQSITKTFGDATFSLSDLLTGVSNSSGAYTFATSNAGAISIGGDGVTATVVAYNATPVTITATQAAAGDYSASSTTLSITVARKAPTYGTFTPPAKTFGAAPFSMVSFAPTSNSSGAYTYTSSAPGVATISSDGTVVTVVSAGSTTITASQDICGNYTAGSTTGVLTVNAATPTYTPASPSASVTKTFGVDVSFSLTSLVAGISNSNGAYTFSSLSSAVDICGGVATIVEYTPSAITITAAQDASGNYGSGSTAISVLINRGTPTYQSISQISKTYGTDVSFSLATVMSGKSNSSGAYTFSSASNAISISGSVVTILGYSASTISILASQDASGNYASSSTTVSLVIAAATPTFQSVAQITKTFSTDVSFSMTPIVAGMSNSDGAFIFTRSGAAAIDAISISGDVVTILAYTPLAVNIDVYQEASGNYTFKTGTISLLVARKVPTYGSFSIPAVTYSPDGSFSIAPYAPTTDSTGVAVTYSSSTAGVATITSDGTLVTVVGQGSTTITASQVANGNYAAGSTTAVFVVNRAAPTFLKAFTIDNKTFGDSPFSLLPFTEGLDNTDGTYSFSSSNPSIVSISTVDNVTATILAYTPSPITITVDIDACGNYAAATTSGTLTVARAAPTYQSVTQVAKTYGVDASFSLTTVMSGKSNSSGAYTFTSDSSAVTVSGSVATIQAYTPEAITITASQDASGNYAASSKTFTVLVGRGTPTYQTVSQVAKTYGVDASFSLTDVMSGKSNSDGAYTFSGGSGVISISSGVATILAYTPSAVTLTASQDASGNYASSTKTFTLLVSRGPPTYQSISQVTKTYGVDASFSLTTVMSGKSNSNGAYTFSSASGAVSISGAVATILAYTPYAITIVASQAADGNYAASSANVSLLVGPGAPTLSNFNNVNKIYGNAPYVITPPTSNSSGAFTYESSNTSVATITDATITIVGSGTSTITATQDASGNYQSGTISSTLTVANPTPTYQSISQISKTYGTDVSFSLTSFLAGVSNSSGAYTFSSTASEISISGDVVTILAYTPYAVSITASQSASGDYNAGSATLSLLVGRAAPTYQSVSQITKTYGVDVSFSMASVVAGISNSDGAYSLFSSISDAVSISGDVVTILSYTSSAIIITATQDASGNYAASSKAISLLVNPGPPTYLSVSQVTKTYGTDVSFSMTTVMSGKSNSNGAYTFSSTASEISISGDVVTILAYTPAAITIKATQAAAGNYTDSSANVTLLVDRKVPSYGAFTLPAVTYEDAPYSLVSHAPTSESNATYSYTSSNSAVATVNSDGTVVTVIGQGYTTITALQDISGNYAAGSTTASLLVNRAAPTFLKAFTIDDKTFGDAPFSLLPFTVGLDNTDGTYHFSSSNTSVVTISEVDGVTATILAYSAATPVTIYVAIDACGNYAASTTNGTLTINRKVPAYQSVSTVAKTFGDAAFSLVPYMTGISESSGSYTFASSDVSSVRIESDGVTATILAYKSSAITITATQAASGNYAVGAKTFSMTVARAAPTIGALALGSLNGYYEVSDGYFTLTAPTSNSSGGFTYSSDNSAVAVVSSPSFSTANLIARYDPSDSSNYTIENGYISYLSDLTGNYSQRLRQNGNGTNVVTVGSKQMLNCSSINTGFYSNLPLPYYNTFFMVIRYNPDNVSVPNLGAFAHHGNRDTDWSILKKPDTENTIILKSNNDNGYTGLTLSPNTSYILVSRLGGSGLSSRELWAYSENGSSSYISASGISISVGTKYMYIGNSILNNSCRSYIGEMIYYDGSISNSDLSNNLSYLQAKWFNASSSTKVVRFIGSGNANISATQDICGNYNTGSASSLLRVGATVPTFGTFTVSSTLKTYGDGPFTLTPPTSNSNGAFTFTSSNSSIISISGTTATIVGGGTVDIIVSQDPSGSFTRKSITTAFTVQPKNPNLRNFPDIVLSYILEGGFTVTAPESDGSGYFTYSSSNIAVVSNSGSGNPGFGITGGGTATITASQIGSQNYAASSVTTTVTINPITPSASYSNFTRAFDVGTFTIPPPTTASNGAVSYVSSDTSVATISGSTVTIKKVGETTITATIAATASYFTRDVSAVFTVTRGTPTIVGLYTQLLTMTQEPYTLSPTSTSTGTFTYVSDNSAVVFITNGGTTFNVASVGTATITATISQDPSGNYNSRNYGFTFTVVRATSNLSSATFTVPVLMTYGDTPVNIITVPTSDSSGAITYTSGNVNIATIHPTTGLITAVGAGWTYFVASQAQTNVYYLSTVQSNYMQFVSKSVTQTRVAPYTSSTITKYYGDAQFQLSTMSESTASKLFTLNIGGVVTASTSSNIGYFDIINVGTVVITGQQYANSQYSTQNTLTWTLTVEKGDTTLTGMVPTLSKNVTNAPFTVAVSSASTGVKSYALSNPDSSNVLVVNSSTGVVTLKGAGTATIIASQAASSLYNAPPTFACVVTVAEAGTSLQGSTITSARVFDNVDMSGASLSNTTVTGVSFAGATMTNAVLTGATVRNATLTTTNMVDATLTNADVSGTSFAGATMTRVTMTGATLTNSTLTSTDLSGASMANTTITGTTFTSSIMTNAVLTGATLTNSTLTSAVLTGASLVSANVTGSTFVGASLAGADLSGATVTNANFTNANISGADITNVAFSSLQKIQLLKNTNNRAIGGIQVGDISGSVVLAAISGTSPAVSIPNIESADIKVVIPTTSTVASDTLPNVVLDTTTSDKFYFPINEGEYFQILGVKYYTSSGVVRNYATNAVVEVISYGNKSIWLIAGSIIASVLAVNTISASTFTVPSGKLDTDAPFNITVAPTSNSDAPIVYSSNHTSVATIHPSTGLITVHSQGYVSFTATQAATLLYEAGSKTSNELHVNKLVNFSLPGLNQEITMATSGLLDSSAVSLETTDATAVFYVKLSDMTDIFKYQTDSFDMNEDNASDVKYYVFNRTWPAALKINPAHAMMNKTESNGMLGTVGIFNANKMLAKHDFLRYLSLKLFNTIHGVDLFNNESDLLENATYWGEDVRTNIRNILTGISTTSSDGTMSYDASGNKYLTNATTSNTNLCRELVRQLLAGASSRFGNITDANTPQSIPLIEDDTINFKITFTPASNQDALTGVDPIPARSYMVKLVMKTSITGLNTPVIDSEMYPNAYPYSSSVVSYAPTESSSAVYNIYSPPAPMPFAKFGFDGWYYTNSTAWVTTSARNHIKWLLPANSGSSTVGSLLYIRANLKIHNKVALPYIMVYTTSNSSRKYPVTNTGALANGGVYSFYVNFNSYTSEPAIIGYTNAALSNTTGSGSFASNEVILNVALETDSSASAGTVDFTLSSIIIGDASGEKEYGFEAAVPTAYP